MPIDACEELLGDSGVLPPGVITAWQCWRCLGDRAGEAILPWRAEALAATQAGHRCQPLAPTAAADHAVVRAMKHRQATLALCRQAWAALPPGGHLILVGGNDIGIKTTAKQVAADLGVAGETVANRARARAVAFVRGSGPVAPPAEPPPISFDGCSLATAWGVFSADGVDAGTAMLLAALATEPPAERVLDIGAGLGLLAIGALRRWPMAQAVCLEADARAEACIAVNAERCGVATRCQSQWWDVDEPLPPMARAVDLVVINPPCHVASTTVFTTGIAEAMFRRAAEALRPGGRVLVVANRQLGYEAPLGRSFADVEQLRLDGQFKILRATAAPKEG